MPFDPNKSFEVVSDAGGGFDPNKPFELVGGTSAVQEESKPDTAPEGYKRMTFEQLAENPAVLAEHKKNSRPGDQVSFVGPGGQTLSGKVDKDGTVLIKKSAGEDTINAALTSAGLNAPASAAFLGTMGATSELAAPLGAFGLVGKAAALVVPLAAGAGAAAMESAAQRKITGAVLPQVNEAEQALAESNPIATRVGAMATSGFRPGLPTQGLRQEVLSRLAPAAAGAGTQLGMEVIGAPKGELLGEGAGGRIAEAGLTNAILSKPTAAGEALMGLGAKGGNKLITAIDSIKSGGNINLKNTEINSKITLNSDEPAGAPKAVDSPALPYEAQGPGEDLSGFLEHAQPREYPDYADKLGLDKAAKTRKATPVQKQIEEMLGLGKSKAADEEDVHYNARVRDEAEIRSQIEEADRAAAMVADNAGVPPPEPKAPLEFSEEKPTLAEKLNLKKKLAGEVDTEGQVKSQSAFNSKVADILGDLKDNGVKVSREKAAELARLEPREFTAERQKLLNPEAPLTKTSPLVLKDFADLPSSTFKAPEATPPARDVQAAQGEIAREPTRPIPDTWKITIQEPVIPGEPRSGYMQVDMLDAKGENAGSTTPAKLIAEGYELPDLSKLKTGQYTAKQLKPAEAVQITPSGERGRLYSNPPAVAAPLAGAIIGYQFGDTPEEKRRNAAIGASLALGGRLALPMVKALAKSSPALLAKINAAAVDARNQGKTTWDKYITAMKEEAPVSSEESLKKNLSVPPADLAETQDAPSGNTASPSPRYQWTPFFSKTKIGAAAKKVLGTIEGNIFPISQRVGGAVREYNGLIDQLKVEWTAGTYEFGQAVRKSMTPQEVNAFDYEMQFGSHAKAKAMLETKPNGEQLVGLMDKAKATYDKMAQAEEKVGRTINRIEDAWPRQMLDYDEFRAGLGAEELGALDKVVKQAEDAKKRPLSEIEKADILNDAVSLSLRGKPSFLKARTVEGLTVDQFLKHYEPFDVAMDNRIAKASRDVAKRQFLGYESPEDSDNWNGRTGSFGEVLQQEIDAGNISKAGQKVIMENLKDHLRQDAAAGNVIANIGNGLSRAQNFLFLGDISTAVAQFGDLFVNIRRYGLGSSAEGLLNRKIKLADLGLGGDTFAETMNLSRNKENQGAAGAARRARDFVVKEMVGWADKVNKESTVNAARNLFSKAVNEPTSRDYVNLYKKYSERFPERWDAILKDLKSKDFADGKLTNNTRFFLFNELADIQPVSMAQRAQLENASSGARWLYSLKRYWIKQLDVLRQEGYEQIKRGNLAEGTKNIGSYLAIVAAMQGLAIGTVRDLMFGRDIDLNENALGGVFQTFGVNRYLLEELKDKEYEKAVGGFVSPAFGVAKDLYSDYSSLVKGNLEPETSKMVKYIPVIGREAYYWEGAGVQAKDKSAQKDQKAEAQGKLTPSLDALSELFAPTTTKKR